MAGAGADAGTFHALWRNRLGAAIGASQLGGFRFRLGPGLRPRRSRRQVGYLVGAERLQVAANTLTCRVDRDGPVLVSFLGDRRLGQVAPRDQVDGMEFHVASLLDLAGTKAAVVQKRAEAKD